MRVRGPAKRIKWKYTHKVPVPKEWKVWLWDEGAEAPLEKLIYRVLTYGKFEDIRKIYGMYPEETYELAFRYPDIKRGVRFWMKVWHDEGED
ncbi:MAG: hypothetical protein GXO39_01770 [Thermotogae bacterium]|nr:hypothetical protein [Thermotogota bacterium]